MTVPTVLFQLTAVGRNPRALDESVRSVLYWTRNTPRLSYRYRIWVVIEPEGYESAPASYAALRADGVEVLVVPREYRTRCGAVGKARALTFASERRRRLGLSAPTVWVYHQDEETSVGQDTLAGLSEFVDRGEHLVGTGIILYPLDWAGGPSHVQELVRSFDDLRVLDSMTEPGNPTTGFHGSHFVVRADAEDAVGWDAAGYAPAEDLLFEMRLRARFGAVFGVLKGFAYEKAAFSMHDQLRQRRRWAHGVLHSLGRTTSAGWRRRLSVGYCALSWFSALPSIAVLLASAVLHYGPVLEITGFFTGFVWVSMVLGYVEGLRLHRRYLPGRVGGVRFVVWGVVGALVDVLAPWVALLTRPSRSDFIRKDRTLEAAETRGVHGASSFASGFGGGATGPASSGLMR
ncbi:MAG TPA: glycosyltransferase family 2 protein [Thermoplasmata archaeon]|nr:glycosyltransferase family 2 protein [Thermoplasmata archaeon]